MNEGMTATRSVVMEREVPHPPAKVWRALTEPALIEAWLMKTAFEPRVGHRFALVADWGTIQCEVREVEPQRRLAYSWGDHDLDSVVTWTLTPTPAGTLLRMEQTGFRGDQPRYYGGAKAGWPRMLDALERTLAGMDGR